MAEHVQGKLPLVIAECPLLFGRERSAGHSPPHDGGENAGKVWLAWESLLCTLRTPVTECWLVGALQAGESDISTLELSSRIGASSL